jgi:hypothetical protein
MRHVTIRYVSFSSKYQYCVLCLVQLTRDSAVIVLSQLYSIAALH